MHTKFKLSAALTLVLCALSSWANAQPLLTITPADYTYHDPAAAAGSTLTIAYTVTNNTPATLTQITASHLPTGMTATSCPSLSANGGSCTVTITIPAALTQKPGKLRSQFQICANHQVGCTLVSRTDQINITVSNNNTFLAITDIHIKNNNFTPITYGQDTNVALWESTQAELTTLISTQSPKFIVLLGDLPAHHNQPQVPSNITTILTGLSGLPAISNNNMPVFYVYGNNDSLVVDYGAFFDGTHNLFYLDPAHNSPAIKGWPTLNANADCTISPNTACTYTTSSPMPADHANDMAHVETEGYYSAYPLGSATPLRFIGINSVIFSHEYLGPAQLATAQVEMDWLADQLAKASANGEAVYIAMHIPVGTDAFNHGNDMWNDTLVLSNGKKFRDNFLALMEQYKANVRGVMSAHTHLGELRTLYPSQTLTSMSVLNVGIPGITPQHLNNPGMQIYLYDQQYQLTEAKTFFTTPTPGSWSSYSFQNDYACPTGSTLFACVTTQIIPNLPAWKLAPQPIPNNPYQLDYPVRAPGYTPIPYSTWLAILEAIQVVPIA